jgi:hypothetical protein
MVDVQWGVAYLPVAWLVTERVGDVDSRFSVDDGVFGLGALPTAIGLAWSFSRLQESNAPMELSATL